MNLDKKTFITLYLDQIIFNYCLGAKSIKKLNPLFYLSPFQKF